MEKIKIIAFHLPQFHPIPENNKWWGDGFTEWRNVAKARPLFTGHRQPLLPGELGFYDLRLPEILEQQAELATWAGISGFCYYHYWFAGRLLLEKPLELLLSLKTPTLPFCLCWANHSWTGHWAGRSEDVIVEQTYPGYEDDRNHYLYLRKFFRDERYITIDKKPVLFLFHPSHIPNLEQFVNNIKNWAEEDGFLGVHIVGIDHNAELLSLGLDALAPHSLNIALKNYLTGSKKAIQLVRHKFLKYPRWVIDYSKFIENFENYKYDGSTYMPTAIPNWDNTPRIGTRGVVLNNSNPELFKKHLISSAVGFRSGSDTCEKVLLIKSWNEWAEGNYLEPDLIYGRAWLNAVREFREEMKM